MPVPLSTVVLRPRTTLNILPVSADQAYAPAIPLFWSGDFRLYVEWQPVFNGPVVAAQMHGRLGYGVPGKIPKPIGSPEGVDDGDGAVDGDLDEALAIEFRIDDDLDEILVRVGLVVVLAAADEEAIGVRVLAAHTKVEGLIRVEDEDQGRVFRFDRRAGSARMDFSTAPCA